MNLPTIDSYGQYSSGNYGVNCLRVSFDRLDLYFSYRTIVAFCGSEGLKVRVNDWNNTTGKHLNWIDGGNKKERLESGVFEMELHKELARKGLVNCVGLCELCSHTEAI